MLRLFLALILSLTTLHAKELFNSFTGKVIANKVRVRVKPDLESHIIRQANKDDLLLIVGEKGGFFAVEPPRETKAYVFRSYVLDDIVEANRVNVRLEPHIDAPIIGQLHVGDKVEGQICPLNRKWLEIAPPKETRFFISKEYVAQVGGPEYISVMQKRKSEVEKLLSSAFLLAETECKKAYEEMDLHPAMEQLELVLRNFHDFPAALSQAKEALALLKETYLNKKIEFLESTAELSPTAKDELIAKHKEENRDLFSEVQVDPNFWDKKQMKRELSHASHFWDTVEESLYLSWSAFHSGKKMDDFYTEQRANATVLVGKVESYPYELRDKPGDFILRKADMPIAYLYSTHVDLEKHLGKTVTLLAAPRPNNHFAFPAYFVLSIDP